MQDDLIHMGHDSSLPLYDPDLAGVQGPPTPDMLARPAHPATVNRPTFTAPSLQTPMLSASDLDPAGLDLRPPFAPDPALPDLTEYVHPDGLTFYAFSQPGPDPDNSDLSASTPQDGTGSDPLLPDLHHPDLLPQVQMPERPGDLAANALTVMQQSATYQQSEQKSYPAVFMDQSGVNTARTRHMQPLMQGLEEC